jgi:hypothetical protein
MTTARLADLPRFKLGEDEGDIRGWKLLDREGRKIGIIEDLIVDTQACTVREAVVYIDEAKKDVRVPIGALTIDEPARSAHTQASYDEVLAMPEIKEWHSRERQMVRATFFPQLANAPLLGELELNDSYFKSDEPRVTRMEYTLWTYRSH